MVGRRSGGGVGERERWSQGTEGKGEELLVLSPGALVSQVRCEYSAPVQTV